MEIPQYDRPVTEELQLQDNFKLPSMIKLSPLICYGIGNIERNSSFCRKKVVRNGKSSIVVDVNQGITMDYGEFYSLYN